MDRMLKPKHVAEQMNVTPAAVYRWVKDGFFPNAIKLNTKTNGPGSVRIPEADLRAFIEQSKVG